jgi:hypothetical protein
MKEENLTERIGIRVGKTLLQRLLAKSKAIDRNYGWVVREALRKYLK